MEWREWRDSTVDAFEIVKENEWLQEILNVTSNDVLH